MVRGAFGGQLPRLFMHAFIADASRCSAPADAAEPGALLGARRGRPGSLPEAGKGGQGGAESDGPPSREERSPGGAFLVSSPESMAAEERSTGKSDGKLDAAGAAARSPSVQPTPPRRLSGRPGCCSPRRRLPTGGARCGDGQLRPPPPFILAAEKSEV